LLAYRRIRRGRLRMVLEAMEDHLRGWRDGKQGLGGERVARGKLAIEHVMPRNGSRIGRQRWTKRREIVSSTPLAISPY
jgi:hypothetical protein